MLNRTFFALTLNKDQKALIEKWRSNNLPNVPDAIQVPTLNLHLNLAFLGNLTEEQIEALFDMVNDIQFNPINIDINTIGHWQQHEILWVGAKDQNKGFYDLSQKLKCIGKKLNLDMDENTYVPHIGIYRHCQLCPKISKIQPLEFHFTFDTFVLFQTLAMSHGIDYHIIRHWKAQSIANVKTSPDIST